MIAKNETDIEKLAEIGRIVALARDRMAQKVAPGVTTLELDHLCRDILANEGAQSAPKVEYDFPGYSCISVNEVACHGIPSHRELKEGDFVNIDVSAVKDGYYSDTGLTLVVGQATPEQVRHLQASKEALRAAIEAAVPGKSTANVGKAIFKTAKSRGFTVLRNLTGHGVGKSLHEEPHYIFNYNERRGANLLKEGQVVALETFISNGDEWVEDNPEGVWPMRTEHNSQIIQFEHTVLVSKDGNKIFTQSEFMDNLYEESE